MSDLPTPPAPPVVPRPPRVHAGRLLLGIAIAVLGVLWFLQALDVTTIDWDLGLPIAVIALGGVLLILGILGRGSGGLVALGIVLTVLLVLSTIVDVPLGGGIGDRTYHPATTVDRTYELAIGKMTIDLTRSSLPTPAPTEIRVNGHVGIGQLVVVVPSVFTGVDVHAKAGVGSIRVFGHEEGGLAVDYRSPGHDDPAPVLFLDLSVGIGQVDVRRG